MAIQVILGINGKISSGKDTLAMMMQALTMSPAFGESVGSKWHDDPVGYAKAYENRPNLKGGWRIVRCADKLKQMAALVLGVPVHMFEERSFKDSPLGPEWDGLTGRGFILDMGKHLREMTPMFFVNALFADYKEGENWIISDVRMPNEFDAVKSRGGMMVRVTRPDNPYPPLDTITETALNEHEFDVEVNNTTFEHFLDQTKAIYHALKWIEEPFTGERGL